MAAMRAQQMGSTPNQAALQRLMRIGQQFEAAANKSYPRAVLPSDPRKSAMTGECGRQLA